jgi:CRISPR/Cas system CSM-associated protein Csm4 (group 5 of RAMP superfamily)
LDEDDITIVLAKHSNILDKLKMFMVKLNETGKDEIKINDIKRLLKDDIEELKTMFIKAQEDDEKERKENEKERKENEKNLKGKNKRLLHPKE